MFFSLRTDEGRIVAGLGIAEGGTMVEEGEAGEIGHLRERLHTLARATRSFAEATDDYASLLDTIAGSLSDLIGDSCALLTLSDNGDTLALATLRSPHDDFVRDCRAVLATPMRVDARPAWQHVVLTGESLLVPTLNLDVYAAQSASEYVDLIRRTGIHSSLVVALRVHGRSIGLLALSRFREASRSYDEADRELAQMLADHAALAIGSARAYAAERAARAAEATAAANLDQLRERARLAAIVEASDDAIIGKTLDGIITSWNRGAQNIFGYTPDEIVGQSIQRLVPPGHESEEAAILETLAQGEARRFETRRLRKDGREIDVAVTTSPLRDPSGRVIGVSKVARDITDRKQAEEMKLELAARKQQLRFRALIENSADGIGLSNEAGEIEYLSPAGVKILGRPIAELIGTTIRSYIHEDDMEDALSHRQRVLAGGQAAPAARRIVRPDGTVRWIEVTATNLLDNPAVGAIVSNVRDITDRKLAEAALVAAEKRFTALFESGIIGIVIAGGGGSVLQANDAFLAMVGYTREDLATGQVDWRKLTPLEWAETSAETNADLLRQGYAKPREKEYFRKDGTRVSVLVGVAVVEGDQMISCSIDLTERKRAAATLAALEVQLRQSQKMDAVGRLAGGVAHDFNNVLSVILSYGELLLADMKPGEPMRDDVEEIRKAGMRAAALTRQLLMFSRQQVLEPKVLDLNEVLTSMDKMLQRILGADVDLVSLPAQGLGRVRVDPSNIEQVIMNLAVNARDAMPTGGKLTMETDNVVLDEAYAREHLGVTPGSHVMLAVSDTGVGMDKATVARIFEPFFTTKEPGKGTGLGLSTVFGIVQQSGGSLWVYSEPGKGTTFKVYLPRVDAAVEAPNPAGPPTTLRGSETILLVEDDDQVRAVAQGILRRNGYHVIEARNAGEALLHSEQRPGTIDLLLSDVVMPQMSGPELAKRLAGPRPEMKVLCMSGYTDDSIVRHGALDARIAYLQKPFTPEALTTKIREVLDGSNGGLHRPRRGE